MELKIYGEPAPPSGEPVRGWTRLRGWRPRWLEEFERWAAREPEPEEEAVSEGGLDPGFVVVTCLLGLALVVQYAQFWIPPVRAFLVERDTLYRAAYAGFTIAKQAVLLVLMLLALAVREERLPSIGFPALNARRITLALGLVVFFLGAAVLANPQHVLQATGSHWLVPIYPGERVLWVLLGLMAAVMEETFFRGFAIVWTYRWSGHLPLAVLFPALVFAAGHSYLGALNLVVAFVVALVFSGIFLWRRDLYWLMVVHFLIDVWVLLV
ncbi:MAG: CPBP family intramembrane glutamic endopeptidase [Candidatus Acidiferrales bacterium]